MNSADLLKLCGDVVRLGERLGADQIEAFGVAQRSIEAIIENNEVKLATNGVHSGIGVRVFRGNSLGFASTNSLGRAALEAAVKEALALSKNTPPDVYNGLPDPRRPGFVPGLYDEAIAESNETAVIERANRMLVTARGIDERVTVDGGRFEVATGEKAIVNSLGVDGSERFTAIYYDIAAHAVDGEKVSSMDYRFDGSRMLRDDRSEELSIDLAEAVVESLSAKKIESFVGEAILGPLAAIDVVISPVVFCSDSNNVQKGISRFAGRRGEQVSSPVLTITDDGTLPSGLSSSTFDREGTPHRATEIVEGGWLKGFLYDVYTAKKEGIESTGHASGGIRAPPAIDSTNIVVKPGNRSLDKIISTVDKGILVQRFSGNVDPVSGDFSGLAKSSKSISDGAIGGAIMETMISGNLFDLLRRLMELSKETEKVMDYRVPSLLVDNISVTGG